MRSGRLLRPRQGNLPRLRFRRYRGEVLHPPGVAHKPNAAKTNSFVFIAEAKRRRQRRPKRVGSDEIWDKAEAALAEATKLAGLDYILNPVEGAFYGPKLEFTLKDSLGRDWQCGTIQVDFNLPQRLGAEYVGKDNQ